MTEKRFTFEIKTQGNKAYTQWYDNGKPINSAETIVDLLNELAEEKQQLINDCGILIQSNQDYSKENEQLKQQLKTKHIVNRQYEELQRLKKEKNELKQLIDLFAQDICDLTEILSKNQLDYKLYPDVENFIIEWGVRIE